MDGFIMENPIKMGNIHLQTQDAGSSPSGLLPFFGGLGRWPKKRLHPIASQDVPTIETNGFFAPENSFSPKNQRIVEPNRIHCSIRCGFFQENPDLFPEYIFWETIRPQMVPFRWTKILVSETPVFFFAAWIYFRTKSAEKILGRWVFG